MAESLMNKVARAITGDARSEEEVELNAKLDGWWKKAENERKEYDWKWFNYDLWIEGQHYARWDKNTQQIITAQANDGQPKVVINKVFTTLRSVRSYVLQNRPKAETTPFNLTEENLDQTVELNQYLDYLHDRLHLRTKLRASMWHALGKSVGFWKVLYSDEENDGEGEITVDVVDPYDLYFDPVARYPSEARYIILAVRRPISDLKDDPMYADFKDWDSVKPDNKLAASSLKERMLSHERGSQTGVGEDDKDGTVIVKEFWYKETKEEEYEEEMVDPNDLDEQGMGKKKMQKGKRKVTKIMLCTKAGDRIIRQPEDTDLTRWPFFRLPSDIKPLQMYGTGWVKNLIPANKMIDRGESSVAEFNATVNKARIIADKGAGVKHITNQHGNIIEKKKGFEVTPFPVPQMAAQAENQIDRGNRYMEDIGSMHDASMGRISSSDQSGRSIEALQEGDSNNLSELVENTEEFLEDVFEYILYLASKKYQFARSIITTTNTGERKFLKVVGEEADERVKGDGEGAATVISSKNIVDVKIVSALAHTSMGRREAVKDLATILPDLPPEVILDAYGTGPIADIVKKMRQNKLQQQQDQLEQQKAEGDQKMQMDLQQKSAEQQMAPQPGAAGQTEAIAFIRMLVNGGRPELPKAVSPEFIKYLDAFANSEEAKALGQDFLSYLGQMRDQAALQMNQGTAIVN